MLLALTSDVVPDPAYSLAVADSEPPTTPLGLVQAASLAAGPGEPTGGAPATAPSAPTGSGSLADFLQGVGDTAQAAGTAYAKVKAAIDGDTATTPVNTAGTVRSDSQAWLGLALIAAMGVGAVYIVGRYIREAK